MATEDLTLFTRFVNEELPKRISTNDNPIQVQPGDIPVATGVGLATEFKSPSAIGIAGKSAYDLAVDNGYVGTVTDWLASLNGGDFRNLRVGLVTAKQCPLSNEGTATLPGVPYGDILLNMAVVHLNDGSVVEVTGVTMDDGNVLSLPPEDFLELSPNAISITVSYIGDLTVTTPQL